VVSKKTSDRMANTEGTAAKSPCKGKTAPPRRRRYGSRPNTGSHLTLARFLGKRATAVAPSVASFALQ